MKHKAPVRLRVHFDLARAQIAKQRRYRPYTKRWDNLLATFAVLFQLNRWRHNLRANP